MKSGFLFITILLISATTHADESSIALKEGPGKALVSANCAICHSLDYIQMNSAIVDEKGWRKIVDKMIRVMGAPIKPEDIGPITAYLANNYGK